MESQCRGSHDRLEPVQCQGCLSTLLAGSISNFLHIIDLRGKQGKKDQDANTFWHSSQSASTFLHSSHCLSHRFGPMFKLIHLQPATIQTMAGLGVTSISEDDIRKTLESWLRVYKESECAFLCLRKLMFSDNWEDPDTGEDFIIISFKPLKVQPW